MFADPIPGLDPAGDSPFVQSALNLAVADVSAASALELAARRADDAALVSSLRAGNEAAAALLFDRYARHVRAIVLHVIGPRSEVADLVHDVFVTAFSELERLENPQAMKAWLSSVAVYQAKNFLRSKRRFRLLSLLPDSRVAIPPTPATPDVSAALHSAYEVLDELPASERIPFVLRTVQGLRMDEVASACGVSLATAKRRVARASERFRKLSRQRPLLRDWLRESAPWT